MQTHHIIIIIFIIVVFINNSAATASSSRSSRSLGVGYYRERGKTGKVTPLSGWHGRVKHVCVLSL